jgi:hypothetical protein
VTLRSILLSLLSLSMPAAAHAATVNVKFCFNLEVTFRDAAIGDYWDTETSVDARYVKGSVKSTGGSVVWDGYADSAGCSPSVALSTNKRYVVAIQSEAVVSGGNQVVVYDDATTPATYTWTASSSYRPSASGTKNYTWPLSASGSAYASNVLAVAHRTIDRYDGGLTSDLFVVYHDPCPGSSSSCMKPMNVDATHTWWPTVFISDKDSFGDRNKYVMAHEMGHLVGAMADEHRRMGGADSTADDSVTSALSTCADGSGHHMESEEWENSAVSEGWAHFYAAVMWNDRSTTDCDFLQWNPTRATIACTDLENFVVDECYTGSSPSLYTGNEGQYLAFWWHLYTDEGYTFDQIVQAFSAADPKSWTAASTGFDVYSDLRDGAIAYGIDADAWDYWAAVTGIDQ